MKAGNLRIKWDHIDNVLTGRHYTVCDILEEEKNISTGVSFCSHKDNFCRETGRKLSLARALKNTNLSKEERTVIWEIYRNTKKGGRW
jgi:hypothetical protein